MTGVLVIATFMAMVRSLIGPMRKLRANLGILADKKRGETFLKKLDELERLALTGKDPARVAREFRELQLEHQKATKEHKQLVRLPLYWGQEQQERFFNDPEFALALAQGEAIEKAQGTQTKEAA